MQIARTIYVDEAALRPETGSGVVADRSPDGDANDPGSPPMPAALDHLVDAGYAIVVVDPETGPPPDAAGWLVTRDAAVCGRARHQRAVRTILVGPAEPGRGLAHRPADLEARNLTAAVLTILAEEAMPACDHSHDPQGAAGDR
jgi:hypothetical protein